MTERLLGCGIALGNIIGLALILHLVPIGYFAGTRQRLAIAQKEGMAVGIGQKAETGAWAQAQTNVIAFNDNSFYTLRGLDRWLRSNRLGRRQGTSLFGLGRFNLFIG